MSKEQNKPKPKVRLKKKSLKERFFKNLANEDAGTITDYIIDNILIPAVMGTIHNIITGTADKIFGGSYSKPGTRLSSPGSTYVNYNQVSKSAPPVPPVSNGNRYDFSRIIWDDRAAAEDIKDKLVALIQGPYEKASVADYFELIGESNLKALGIQSEFTDNKYGWKTPKGITVAYSNGGHVIVLPSPVPLTNI